MNQVVLLSVTPGGFDAPEAIARSQVECFTGEACQVQALAGSTIPGVCWLLLKDAKGNSVGVDQVSYY